MRSAIRTTAIDIQNRRRVRSSRRHSPVPGTERLRNERRLRREVKAFRMSVRSGFIPVADVVAQMAAAQAKEAARATETAACCARTAEVSLKSPSALHRILAVVRRGMGL